MGMKDFSKSDWPVNPEDALHADAAKTMRPQTYVEIMRLSEDVTNTAFQDLFAAYYALRHSRDWQEKYFKRFQEEKESYPYVGKDLDIEELKERMSRLLNYLAQLSIESGIAKTTENKTLGFVELSFASKMLATIDPRLPIWDSNVQRMLKMIDTRFINLSNILDRGKRLSRAVEIYELLIHFYREDYRKDALAGFRDKCVDVFDEIHPEYKGAKSEISDVKKVDFILWILGKERQA